MIEPATFNRLRQFRARVYDCFGPRRDALFELLDAATVAGLVPSLAYLSLPPVHRRRWGSLYDTLAAGDVDAPALRELVACQDGGEPEQEWLFEPPTRLRVRQGPPAATSFSPQAQSSSDPA
jgi:hypothetical protein